MNEESDGEGVIGRMKELAADIESLPHADVLGRFAGALYTPEAHNEMVDALRAAGVEGDLDEEVAKFANQPADVQAHVIKRAQELRAATAPE